MIGVFKRQKTEEEGNMPIGILVNVLVIMAGGIAELFLGTN